jgi:hypothetical protein
MTPNQLHRFGCEWESHYVGQKIDAAISFYVSLDCAKILSGLPQRCKRSFGSEDKCPAGLLFNLKIILQPKIKRPVPRMAIAARTSCVGDAVSGFDVIQKPVALPTATRAFELVGQELVAKNYRNSISHHSRKQTSCRQQTVIFYLSAKPGEHDLINARHSQNCEQ